jgi:fatty-acyl-CoA synthase
VVVPKFDAGWLLTNVAALGINGFSAVPTMLAMLVDHPHWEAADLSSLRLVIYGGSTVSDRVARAWQARGLQVLQGYGMTEASPGVFLATPEGAQQRPVSIGVPHFFTDIAHLGPDGPIPVQPGVEAELLIQGPNVFSGYWNRPEDTEASKEGDWFRTGDVVRVEADGWGYAIDRVKDMIISGGENIYPAEVEAVLITMPQVSDCAVVAVPDERWGEVGMAMISLRPGQTLSEADVRDFLAQRLARYKVPKYFTFLDSLPRNATGKILRSQLRSQARQKLT